MMNMKAKRFPKNAAGSASVLPAELPEKGVGITARMMMHINMGNKPHTGVYRAMLGDLELPFGRTYGDDGHGKYTQWFWLDDCDKEFKTYEELRAYWPTYIAGCNEKDSK